MRPTYNRKTSPKVIGGLVQRKNNHVKTARLGYVVDRIRPARGFKHVVSKKDIHDFTDIIPDWADICEGIESIILDCGDDDYDGLYRHYDNDDTGVIWLSAWPEDLWVEFNDEYYREHLWLLKILGVVSEKKTVKLRASDGEEKVEIDWLCFFTKQQAKAFMLMHIFLHELGHHVDKLRSRNKDRTNGGEAFAENYAVRRFHELWPAYIERFNEVSYQ